MLTTLNHCPCRAQPTFASTLRRSTEMHPFLMAWLPQELLFDHFSLIAHCASHWCHQLQQMIKCIINQSTQSLETNLCQSGCPAEPPTPIRAQADFLFPLGPGKTLARVLLGVFHLDSGHNNPSTQTGLRFTKVHSSISKVLSGILSKSPVAHCPTRDKECHCLRDL